MGRVKFKWNLNAFAEVRTLPAVMAEVDRVADAARARAGSGYVLHSAKETGGRVRGRAAVSTGDFESARDNAKNNSLVRALGGGSS